MNRISHRWSDHLEEPPGRFATAQEVADYLYDDVEGAGLIWAQDETEFRPLSPFQAKRYCEYHQHNWKQISPLLRQKRAAELVRRYVQAVTRVTDTGVVVNQSVVNALEEAGWLPKCPSFWSGFHRADYHFFTTGGDCDKWWCPDCGTKKLAALLAEVNERTAPLDAVYTASAAWHRGLAGRMRQRWSGKGVGVFWYRRFDGHVFYVASVSLAPKRAGEEPVEWTERAPQEAASWLAEAMVLPGYVDHNWSKPWRPKSKKDGPDFDDLDDTPQWRWFQLTRAEADMVHGLLEVEVLKRFGMELDYGIPEDLRPEVDALLDHIVQCVRAERYGQGGHDPER